MNLYYVKFKDRADTTYQYVVASSMKDVIEALVSTMPDDNRDEWSFEDLYTIKLVERNVQIIKDE